MDKGALATVKSAIVCILEFRSLNFSLLLLPSWSLKPQLDNSVSSNLPNTISEFTFLDPAHFQEREKVSVILIKKNHNTLFYFLAFL